MSKGSPVVHARVPYDLYDKIQEKVQKSMERSKGEPHNVASFVVFCLKEHFDKLERAKKSAGKAKAKKKEGVYTPPGKGQESGVMP